MQDKAHNNCTKHQQLEIDELGTASNTSRKLCKSCSAVWGTAANFSLDKVLVQAPASFRFLAPGIQHEAYRPHTPNWFQGPAPCLTCRSWEDSKWTNAFGLWDFAMKRICANFQD